MLNPFETLDQRLANIENMLLEMKQEKADKEPFADLPELLTRRQACNILKVGYTTLDRYANEGKITRHRTGAIIRFKKSEILKNLKSIAKYQRG
jgi:excisionase family DNA binding protein